MSIYLWAFVCVFFYIAISPLSFSRCLSLSLPMFVDFVVYTPGLGGDPDFRFLGFT